MTSSAQPPDHAPPDASAPGVGNTPLLPGRRLDLAGWRELAREIKPLLAVWLGLAIVSATREVGVASHDAGVADWLRVARAALARFVVPAGFLLVVIVVARLAGLRTEREWAAERAAGQGAGRPRPMLLVWLVLAVAAIVIFMVPKYR